MLKKKLLFVLLCNICFGVFSQDSREDTRNFDWMNDPNDPVMRMLREEQENYHPELEKRSDLDTPPMWGGTPIEGMFILYSKTDTREKVLFRNRNRVQPIEDNHSTTNELRFVNGNKRAFFQFGGKSGIISSVEMEFENRTLEDYTHIVNNTKNHYGSALIVIRETPYYAASRGGATIGVAVIEFNVWGRDGWTIEIEFVTRNVPMSGENSHVLRIRESKNIIIGR